MRDRCAQSGRLLGFFSADVSALPATIVPDGVEPQLVLHDTAFHFALSASAQRKPDRGLIWIFDYFSRRARDVSWFFCVRIEHRSCTAHDLCDHETSNSLDSRDHWIHGVHDTSARESDVSEPGLGWWHE